MRSVVDNISPEKKGIEFQGKEMGFRTPRKARESKLSKHVTNTLRSNRKKFGKR